MILLVSRSLDGDDTLRQRLWRDRSSLTTRIWPTSASAARKAHAFACLQLSRLQGARVSNWPNRPLRLTLADYKKLKNQLICTTIRRPTTPGPIDDGSRQARIRREVLRKLRQSLAEPDKTTPQVTPHEVTGGVRAPFGLS